MKRFLRFIKKSRYLLAAIVSFAGYASAQAASGDTIIYEPFNTADDFAKWTIVDGNGGRTWEFRNGAAAYMLDYQTGLPGDDWYISPEITLDAGRVYQFSFDLAIASKRENLRVCLGTSADTASFTQVIDDFYNADKTANGTKTYVLHVKTSGTYRLGFYAYSAAKMYRVEIDNVLITDLSAASVPGKVTDLAVTPADKGGMTAAVAFTAPSVTASGETMSSQCDVSISRNGTVAKTFSGIEPGAAVTWTDDQPEHGFNTYSVVASNTGGAGQAVEQEAFVGLDKPMPVTNAVAKINSDMSVTVTWTAPTASVNGGYVDFANITYNISRNGTSLSTGLTGTTYTDKVPVDRGQALVSYSITPVAATEVGDSTTSSSVACGTPLSLPYKESFAGQKMTNAWFADGTVADFAWSMIGDDEDGEYEGIMTQDSDGGMIYANTRRTSSGKQSRFVSPLIDISTAANPVLTFWFYKARSPWYDPEYDGSINDRVQVQISYEGGEWTSIDNAAFYQNENSNGWTKCEVTLPKGTAAFVNVGLLAIVEHDDIAYRNIYVDNLSIDEAEHAKDLVLNSFDVDKKRIDIDSTATFTATVFNRGGSTATGYTVDFYRDGQVAATVAGPDLDAAKTATVTCTMTATPADVKCDSIVWSATVVYADDELTTNNTSDEIVVTVRASELPPVNDLSASGTLGNAKLTWSPAAAIEAIAHGTMTTITDDFENYTPFIISGIGDWTTYDGDKATTLNTPRIPNDYAHRGEPMAFQVFNVEQAGVWIVDSILDDAFRPHLTGSKQMLICPSVDYPAENDDWLFTPQLDGRAQTITFYARAASYDAEWINVYYSTTDNHHDSFTKLNDGDQLYVNDNWQQFSFEVPEGTRYFAVRCVRRSVILEIDDFTYAPYDGSREGASVLGYNVYRNDVKLNDSPVTTTEFTDAGATSYDDIYTVTVVYDRGESIYSNECQLASTGIAIVPAGNGAVPVARYTVDGRSVSAPVPGVNIVRMSDGTVRKELVR